MVANYNMIVDFARPTKTNTIIISENDANSRNCNFQLLFDKAPFDMTGVITALVKGITSSGSIIWGQATINMDDEGNPLPEVSFLLPASISESAGNIVMVIELQGDNGEIITSFETYLKVRNALYNEDDYVSEDDMEGFRDLLTRSRQALERMEQMVQQDALPNPFPLRINVDNPDPDPENPYNYEYTGASLVEIDLGEIAYLNEIIGTVEVTEDDSAAAQAARSAAAAQGYAESAEEDAGDAADSLQAMIDLTNDFQSQIPTVTIVKSGHTSTITITDKDGSTSEVIEDGVVGNRWFSGTDFSGNTPGQTGVAGNVDDYYLNPVEGKVYKCVSEGDATTALWDYYLTLGGGSGATTWGNILGTLSDQQDLLTALNTKQDELTFDTAPISGSTNPVTSNGIYGALDDFIGPETADVNYQVEFDDLDDSYGYELWVENAKVAWKDYTIGNGTTSGKKKLTYTVNSTNVTAGNGSSATKFYLRVFK